MADRERHARAARTPDMNNPLKPAYQRPERRTQRPYRDPTGERAVGNVKKETEKL